MAYVLTFTIVTVLPGDPVTTMLRDPQNGYSEEEIRQLSSYYGLDQPVLLQLVTSLGRFLIGDFGVSLRSNTSVGGQIALALPSTLALAGTALVFALILALAIGYASQYLPKRYGQGFVRSLPSLFLSVPNFVIGLLLIHVFAFGLGAFQILKPEAPAATFFAAVALGIPVSAQIAEVLVANLDHERSQESTVVSRARGLTHPGIFFRHLLKPSLLPVITIVALAAGELLGGSLITETVFGRNGIGTLVQKAVVSQDLPILQATVSLAAVVFVVINFVTDLVYPLLDPRLRSTGIFAMKSSKQSKEVFA
nr:ABC transporter permease [Pseudoclavibacter sp. 13-3]